jgi:hypothetical protein
MSISDVLLKLLIVFIPGAIGIILYKYINNYRHDKSDFWEIYFVIIYSFLSYGLYDGIVGVINHCFHQKIKYIFINLVYSNIQSVSLWGIFWASIISLILCILFSGLNKSVKLFAILQKLNISQRYSNNEVWQDLIEQIVDNYVYVRDFKHELTYFGKVDEASEPYDDREIYLSDVTIYPFNNSEPLYSLKGVYLSFKDKDSYTIELPN